MPGTRTPLFARTQPGGLFSIINVPGHPGDILFVHSGTGTNGAGYGQNPDAPLATIDYAIGLCTASKGDVIYVLPGHAETLTTAAQIAADVAGVSIVGLGNGRNRPVLTYTATAATIDVSAANVTFRNLVFVMSGIDAVVAGIQVTGADFALLDCEVVISDGTAGVVQAVVTAATATRFRVERCHFSGPATSTGTTTTACIDHEVGVDYVIRDNYFTGKMTQAIQNGAAVLRGLIDNNRFVIATGTKAINMHASSTPFVSNNRINVPSGTAPVVAAAGFMAGNVYSAAAGVTAGTASTF